MYARVPCWQFHSAQNAITQSFFAEYTKESDNAAYYVSEVGILIAAAWVIAALLFWRKRGALATLLRDR